MYLQLVPHSSTPWRSEEALRNNVSVVGTVHNSRHTAFLSTSAPHHISSSTDLNGPFLASDKLETGLLQNKQWASRYRELFPTLAVGQQPEILWIGCSDSRCPETAILGLKPGDVFVHRNIANVIHYSDLNSACVIEYAVVHLKVKHIVVCGHTACGGVNASLGNTKLGILDAWLLPLRRLRQQNLAALQALDPSEAIVKLSELNIMDGVAKLKENSAVLDAIEQRGLKVHGLIYDVASGLLRSLGGGDDAEPHDFIKSRLTAFKTQA
jgi:carbonic anhydrase